MIQEADEYRLVFENAPLGLLSFNREGIIQTCNDRFIKIMGSSREKLIGLNMLRLPDTKVVEAVQQALAGGTGRYEGLYQSVTSGRIIPLRGLFTSKRQGDQPVQGGVGIIEDITEQYMAAQVLKDSEEKFRLVFSHSKDGLLIADPDGRISDWNHTYEEITGISESEARGRSIWDIQFESTPPEKRSPELYNIIKQSLQQALATGIGSFLNKPIETELVSKSGKRIAVENVGFLIPSSRGFLFGDRMTDISERKAAQSRIHALLEEKSLILKEVHHRIKNNMATVVSLLTLQAGMINDETARDALLAAAGRVNSMMLLYEKLYTGSMVGSAKASDYIPSLVDEILQNNGSSTQISSEISVEDVELDVKTLQTLGIIINELVTNAIKYAFVDRESGVITVSLKRSQDGFMLYLADNGWGFDLSDGFIQDSDQKQGKHGFGMTLVHLLAEQLQGKLHIESEGGTKITLQFRV
ncbi:PAS domain S-box protein [Gracilinema caldarium]|uniref:PAS domain S-box protein n=1 Tax=Gracilinema caldarium TaxID=215591 RepID=UPI0026F1019B|nr:PAS domain S-box protein [Gracilinema caldarium]